MLYRDPYIDDWHFEDSLIDAYDFFDGVMYADIGRRGVDFYDVDPLEDWEAEMKEYLAYQEEEITPRFAGGSRQKRWWTYSRRDSKLEQQIRRRQRDWEFYWPNYWKHGRDLPDKWETGDLKNRDVHRDFYRRERRKTRRNRRDSMRFWGADYTPPLGEAHLDAFVGF